MMPCQDMEEQRTLDIRHRRSAVISFSARQIQRTTSGDVEFELYGNALARAGKSRAATGWLQRQCRRPIIRQLKHILIEF